MSGYPATKWKYLAKPRVDPIEGGSLVQRFLNFASRREAKSSVNLTVVATFLRMNQIFPNHLLMVSQLLMKGNISRADKERIVLRTGWRLGNIYEWSHHVALALNAGVSRQEIESIASEYCADWSPKLCTFVTAVDELIDTKTLSDDTWNELRVYFTDAQAMEFCMLVGHYVMVAMNANTLGVQVEDEFALGPMPQPITWEA